MRKLMILGVFCLTVLAAALPAGAEDEGSLRFEKTISYRTDKLIDLGAKVGPVRVAKVELSEPKGGSVRDSIVGRIRGGGGGSAETQSTIRASFDAENPQDEEWVVTFTLDFLDKNGKLIDRAVKSQGLEGEAKVVQVDHSILTYVLPMIDRVEVRLEARLD